MILPFKISTNQFLLPLPPSKNSPLIIVVIFNEPAFIKAVLSSNPKLSSQFADLANGPKT